MAQRSIHSLLSALFVVGTIAGCGVGTALPQGANPAFLSANLPDFTADIMAAGGGAKRVKGEFGEVTLGLIADGKIPGDTPQYERLKQGGSSEMSAMAQSLPKSVDLRKYCAPIRNQGNLGSCTAFSSTALLEFYYRKAGKSSPRFSPLFVYYTERAIMESGQKARGEKTKAISQDTGASSYLAVYTLTHFGAAPEETMPYQDGKEALKVTPSDKAQAEAAKYRPKLFAEIKTIQGMKKALSDGHAFILGMRVYPSFMTGVVARTGKMITVGDREEAEGGHSVMCVGYDDEKQAFIIRNSWGDDWGQKGYFEMPYEFVKPNKMYSCFTIL